MTSCAHYVLVTSLASKVVMIGCFHFVVHVSPLVLMNFHIHGKPSQQCSCMSFSFWSSFWNQLLKPIMIYVLPYLVSKWCFPWNLQLLQLTKTMRCHISDWHTALQSITFWAHYWMNICMCKFGIHKWHTILNSSTAKKKWNSSKASSICDNCIPKLIEKKKWNWWDEAPENTDK